MTTSPTIYEVLARQFAYVDNNPQFQNQVQLGLNAFGYRIDRTFDDPNTGFHAIALVSTTPDKPPVLVFRGSDTLVDDRANTDRRGIGFNQFEANKATFGDWLSQISQDTSKNPNKLPPDLVGHSLGGALAQLAATEFTATIGDVVTFNSPGIPQQIANTFKQKAGTGKNVTHYLVSGDFVSLGGEAFLPGKAILLSYTTPEIDPLIILAKHTAQNLLSSPPPGLTLREISVDELNQPTYTYSNDSDFETFKAGLAAVNAPLATVLNGRQNLEQFRTSEGFSFFGFINLLETLLDPSESNYLLGDEINNLGIGFDGDDTIFGGGGNDSLSGGAENDVVNGNAGNDFLLGGKGNDSLLGGQDSDTLVGGLGSDVLLGGNDRDIFVLAPGQGTDTIADFQVGQDLIALPRGLSFNGLRITQVETSLAISLGTGEVLARLTGSQVTTLSASDFITI